MGVNGVAAQAVDSGVMTHKVLVQHPMFGEFIVRFYPTERSHVVNYEPDLFTRLHTVGIVCPEVIADSRSGPSSNLSYVVYRPIPGVTLDSRMSLMDDAALAQIASDIADILKRISRLEVQGFGDLINAELGASNTCRQFINSAFGIDFSSLQASGILPSEWCERLIELRANLRTIDLPLSPSLAWGDLSPQNVIVDRNNRVAGIIDLESMIACDALTTAGFFFARHGKTRLYAALRSHIFWNDNAPRFHLYSVLRAVRILRYASLPLPTGIARIPIEKLLPGAGESLFWLSKARMQKD